MSTKSNNQGRAYEFVCLNSLYEAISKIRSAKIIQNSSYDAAEKAWKTLDAESKTFYTLSAQSTINTIFALEPNIIAKDSDLLALYIQTDKNGEYADVRDIIIERKEKSWEIGLSIKHNHEAVKHSRIASCLDFGEKWYGVPCSDAYWKDVNPIFTFLESEKMKGTFFNELKSKVYVPLLKAFKKEISMQVKKNREVPRRLIEYLLSKYDFYKVVSLDKKNLTTIQSFNMYGTLNLACGKLEPELKVPIINLPENLIHVDFKNNSKTTINMIFDNGWQFSFRIHNANKKVEPSLKFDIQIIGMPVEVNIKYNCLW